MREHERFERSGQAPFRPAAVRARMALWLGVSLSALAAFGSLSRGALRLVAGDSPLQRRLASGEERLAAVRAPLRSLTEAYLVARQMGSESDPGRLAALARQGQRLSREYAAQQEQAVQELPPGALRQTVAGDAGRRADAFLQIRDRQFLPAVLTGHRRLANTLLHGPLQASFQRYRAALEEAIDLATGASAADERAAFSAFRTETLRLTALGIGVLLLLAGIGYFNLHRMAARMGRLSLALETVAEGEASRAVYLASNQVIRDMDLLADRIAGVGSRLAEIREGSRDAAAASTTAAAEVRKAGMSVAHLDASIAELSGALKAIASALDQMKLLALNATLEAARAGEAGRGFVVLAGEVKQMAQTTAGAVAELGQRLEAQHEATREAAQTIAAADARLHALHGLQEALTGAVEQRADALEAILTDAHGAAADAASTARRLGEVLRFSRRLGDGAFSIARGAHEPLGIPDSLDFHRTAASSSWSMAQEPPLERTTSASLL